VVEPTGLQRVNFFIADHTVFVILVLSFLFVIPYAVMSWWLVGRGPPPKTVVPHFSPPRDLSPAAARFICRMDYDHETFSAALLSAASKRLISISDDDSGFEVSLTGQMPSGNEGGACS